MNTVRIYQPIKNPMQSGKARQPWLVEYVAQNTRFIEPMMGWTGNTDTKAQLQLEFPTQDEAVAYAKAKGLHYDVIQAQQPKLRLQAYADNFC